MDPKTFQTLHYTLLSVRSSPSQHLAMQGYLVLEEMEGESASGLQDDLDQSQLLLAGNEYLDKER